MNIKNLKVVKGKIMPLLISGMFALSLVGCSSSKQGETVSSSVENVQISSSSKDDNLVTRNLENADTAVEAAVGIMVEGADELANASYEARQTESYQKAKEDSINNFKDLVGFLFYGEELAGYTIHDVKDSTVEKVKIAKDNIEEDLEVIAPNYKERIKEKWSDFKEWLNSDETKDKLADGYNKIEDKWRSIKDYGNDVLDRARSK